MEIAKNDQRFTRLQSELEAKRMDLRSRLRELKNIQQENKYVTGVIDDYNKYYNVIKNQKREELAALQMISQYIDSVAASTTLTEDAIKQSRIQQHELLTKADKIKKELDEVLGITEEANPTQPRLMDK
tara:strand:+ start:2738 stop:3124 length:387 start_codon:yes stop_codon:yes gene_type:complete